MSIEFDENFARECVKLDNTNLQGEFIRYTGDLSFWGTSNSMNQHRIFH